MKSASDQTLATHQFLQVTTKAMNRITHLKAIFLLLISIFALSGCIVVPWQDDTRVNKCEISSDKLTLKIIDVAKATNSYYSISGLWLVPVTGVVSGTYVAVNNVYHLGEETIVCK